MVLNLFKIVSLIALPIFLPLLAISAFIFRKKSHGFFHHIGLVPFSARRESTFSKTIWLFALSVGEVGSAVPLLKTLKKKRPDIRIVVSVATEAGFETAKRTLNFVENIFFHPLDFWPFWERALRRIRPDLFILTETGFWPGQLALMKKLKIPSFLFQGRISEKSANFYGKFKVVSQEIFNCFNILCVQSKHEASKFEELGIAQEKIRVLGNSKFDGLKKTSDERWEGLLSELTINPATPVLVAGSTHEGEEGVILEVFSQLQEQFPDLVLILAPRRMERIQEVISEIKSRNLNFVKRSLLEKEKFEPIVLLDTIGELADIYSIATVAFVGKSLFPPGGGHSLAEPAAQGVPVCHGPYMEYQRDMAEAFGNIGATITVHNIEDMKATIEELLKDTKKQKEIGEKAQKLVLESRGATEIMVELILMELDKIEEN
jgi:3-deoxy-D-manno-octulosonic-acid transferase